jgi:taurine transport system permease protein
MTATAPELADPVEAGSDPGRIPVRGRGRGSRAAVARRVAIRVGAIAGLLGLWWAIAAFEIWPEMIVPSPGSVWGRFVESVTEDGARRGLEGHFLWEHLLASGRRLVVGVVAAIVVGVAIGLAMATVRPIRTATEPLLNFVRSLPPLAYFSLLIIWFGIEDTSKYWLLFIAAVAPIALSVVAGAESIRPEWFDAARSQGASRLQVVRHVVVPAVRPELFTGIRIAIGFAFTTIVAAETVNGVPGIGGLAWSTKKFNQTDIAVLCVIVIGLCAVAIDQIIRAIERRAVPWKGRA